MKKRTSTLIEPGRSCCVGPVWRNCQNTQPPPTPPPTMNPTDDDDNSQITRHDLITSHAEKCVSTSKSHFLWWPADSCVLLFSDENTNEEKEPTENKRSCARKWCLFFVSLLLLSLGQNEVSGFFAAAVSGCNVWCLRLFFSSCFHPHRARTVYLHHTAPTLKRNRNLARRPHLFKGLNFYFRSACVFSSRRNGTL